MEQTAVIAGTAMTRFCKTPDRGLKSLAGEAITAALADAGISPKEIQAAYMGNAAGGVVTGQEMISGQVVLRPLGIGGIPVINVENACATSSTALQQAARMIALGEYDIVLVAGFEKLASPDKARTFAAFAGAVDVEMFADLMPMLTADKRSAEANGKPKAEASGGKHSLFMDIYALAARAHMKRFGSTARDFAMVSAKNAFHGSMNPKAQYQEALSVEEVLSAPLIADPLTLPMCAPIGDGAAALVVMSEQMARRKGIADAVRIRASVLASGFADGTNDDNGGVVGYAARRAYEIAGIGPEDIHVLEVHDATAPAEILCYEALGLAPQGEGQRLIEDGVTRLGGKRPVNTSGGLLRKGHPIGASGAGQIVELVEQLRGRSGQRQVPGAKRALAENGGGFLGTDAAAVVVSILERA
jgi:acetyl-CoA acetyltransferase